MFKYFVIVLKLLPYLIYKTPQILYIYYKRNKYSLEYKYKFINNIMLKIKKAFNVDFHVEGLENLPSDGNYILYPNHQSNYDPLALFTIIDKPISFVGKKEVKKMPYIWRFFEMMNCIYMDREDIRQSLQVMKEVERRVSEEKNNFCIFPEGTRTRNIDRSINEYKPGAFKPAYRSQAYIVPVLLNGTYRVLSKKYRRKSYRVDIKFLQVIPYEEYKDILTSDLSLKLHDLTVNALKESCKDNPID